ncbi:MAG TPA: molybdopterin-dependent oxidoreductase [Dyella sp.]|uniref:molybdopterin-dependent oxidoreductase n=1 Tax=Dyella sp. TaxID=1869338 RepID=UPI002D7706C2|nr:molybdopterin-dependent oxidoreductase [Dyella sp.]HET6552689.1 molybdopterin-dependent oxidoreductase [Dyella sp.]
MANTALSLWRYLNSALILCFALAVDAQDAAPAPDSVHVAVPGKSAIDVDRAMMATMERISVTAAAHEEKSSEWRGVALRDILLRAGAPLDKPLRGKALAMVVRVTATDHYQVVFALSDFDPSLGNAPVLLVDQRDGQPLASDGPFRLLVKGDQRPARWVRSVSSIEVVDASTARQP